MNNDLWRILGNVARGHDPRDGHDDRRGLLDALFPGLVWARACIPLAVFLLFCFVV